MKDIANTGKSIKTCVKCGGIDFQPCGKCRPCSNEASKIFEKNNIEKRKEYRAANSEKRKATASAWRKENREQANRVSSAWAKNNADRVKDVKKQWRKENNSKVRAYCQNRRKRIGDGAISGDAANKLMQLQKGKCACCKTVLNGKYHIDHIMPLLLGGAHKDANLQLLCQSCNQKKHAKHPVDFMQSQGYLL